ncbi:hypothetical protein [Lichenibacterium ramalinae]|uniref:hypothetical protein n=1 Tax=Lichenibacterium ramalinae TaxID=2316527 RepID=UPI0026868FD2
MPSQRLTIELDPDLVATLRHAAAAVGTTPEALAAEAVAQAYEVGLRHRVLVERIEAVDAQIAAIARFVEEATAPADGGGIDLERLCRYPRKPK